jgi:CO/xanthine dehydrogenase Mo-binding subunit
VHTQIVADTIGVPYDWVTMDVSNTDSSPICTGSFASRGTFIGGNAVRFAAERVREKILEIASKEMEIDPADLEIADGEVLAKGAPDRKLGLADVAAAATWTYGELITGTGAAFKKYATVDDDTGEVDSEPHSAISYARASRRSRSTTRPARSSSTSSCRSTTSAVRSTRPWSRARSRGRV